MTFGFVARARGSAGLRGARFQAVSDESSPAGIGWNLWGMLPHLLPQVYASDPSATIHLCCRPVTVATRS